MSFGGEYAHAQTVFGQAGDVFGAVDTSYRSDFSSSASESRYLVVDGYALVNARVGFRASDGWTVFLWSRNLLDKNYYELLTAAPGNTGLFVGQPGDGRTVGLTLRLALKRRFLVRGAGGRGGGLARPGRPPPRATKVRDTPATTHLCRLLPCASMVTIAGKSRTSRCHIASGVPNSVSDTPSTRSMQRA